VHPRWPVEIHPIGRTAAATLAWRHRGRLRVSVVAKATFAFTLDGPMTLIAPDDLHVVEAHRDGDPAQSLFAASDLVPYRTHADVVLTGHAPVPDESTTVGLAVYRDRALIDKSFDVIPSGDLEGMHRVPLVYEQTPGGPEWDENPVGTSLPSIVDSSDPQRPVGFGPIAAAWPVRARRLGGSDPRPLSAPIPVLPDDLDWRYYSAAPADQVMEYLQGDEWIVLDNLIEGCPTARMQLPMAHAEARIFGLGPAPIVKMLADSLHLDLDRGTASITWRGSFEIPHEETMRSLAVMVGVAVAGQPIVWPALPAPRREPVVPPAPPSARAPRPMPPLPSVRAPLPALVAPLPPPQPLPPPSARLPPLPSSARPVLPVVPPPPQPPSARLAAPVVVRGPLPIIPPAPPSARVMVPSDDWESTSSPLEMTMEIKDEATSPPPLPFLKSATPRLPAPQPPPQRAVPEPDNPFESTMTMSGDEVEAAIAPVRVLPFAPAPQARPVIPPSPPRESSYSLDEASLVEDEPEETTVPMAKAFRRARSNARPSQGIPGAPWSDVPAAPVPRPAPEIDETTRTIRRDELLAHFGALPRADAPPPAVAAELPPIAPPPTPKPKAEPAPSWSWVSTADAPKVEMNPPRPPRPPPTPAVKNSLYKGFTSTKKK
jgi:hypothetical protein